MQVYNFQSLVGAGALALLVAFSQVVPAIPEQRSVPGNMVVDTEEIESRSSSGFRISSLYRQRGDSSLVSDGSADPVYEADIAVSQQGYYRLYAWWPQVPGNKKGGEAHYHIATDGPAITVTRRQAGYEGQWIELGDIAVLRTDKIGLAVTADSSATVAVDAFRIEYLGLSAPSLVITTTAMEVATRGQSYTFSLTAAGASGELSWISASALPRGLQLNQVTGMISGSPQETGVFNLEVHASQDDGSSASVQLELVVVESLPGNRLSGGIVTGSQDQILDPVPAGSGSLLDEVAAMPEGSWKRVNQNLFSDSWTPPDLRTPKGFGTTVPTPHKLILAWSSFAWDYHTGTLFLYGGGHANYAGNDVYLWRSSTRTWERASLPSEVTQNDLGTWQAIDGPMAAPNSAHTYDNNVYLPEARRFMIYGGAAYDNGGAFTIQTSPTTERPTGPYTFDPLRADPWKVGGTTGSHVQRVAPYPEITGGQMWSNRDIYANIPGSPEFPSNYVMAATAVVTENGNDVIYVNAKSGGSARQLYKHTIRDINDPTQDTFEKVGKYFNAFGQQAAGAYSARDNVFVRAGNTFTYWDLDTAGPGNPNVLFVPADPSGDFTVSFDYGLDYSPVTEVFYMWDGGPTVWRLVPPAVISSEGWLLEKESFAGGDAPYDDAGTGILGKWKFARDLNAFVALQDPDDGNVWIYKPAGWQPPGRSNQRPSVALTSPGDGDAFNPGETVFLAAQASDADGTIVSVQFYNGTQLLGESTGAPYSFSWFNVPVGNHALTARAADDGGAIASSATVNIVVASDNVSPEVTLTDPVDGGTFTMGTAIEIRATASDVDGTVATVEFYQGATLLGSDAEAPFVYDWVSPSAGTYQLQARAVDDEGAVGSSDFINITVVDGNIPPAVTLVSPASGETFVVGDRIILAADAMDEDGTIASVTFLNGNEVVFEDNSAPFRYDWAGAPRGSLVLTAMAVDNSGATTTSAPSQITVSSSDGSSLVTLQQGLDGYSRARDSYLTSSNPGLVSGSSALLLDKTNRYRALVGFSIFQTEGGPVPDGAIISSARLSLYKYSSYDHNYGLFRLLQPWVETETNWNQRQAGVLWAEPGAAGAGSDYAPVADAAGYVGWSPGWLELDVTDAVQGMSLGQRNHGWILLGTSGNKNTKRYYSNESTADAALRPKLEIDFSFGGNLPPSVSLTSPLAGATFVEGEVIPLAANATDADGSIASILFYDGETLLFEDNAPPYQYDWAGAAVGTHTLTARVVDDQGGMGDSAPLNVEVRSDNLAPAVTLTSPDAGGSFLQGEDIILAADASDSDGVISRVDFYNGAVLLASDSVAPYEFVLSDPPLGNLTLTALAVDEEGAETVSDAVVVNVQSADGSIEAVLQYGAGGYLGARDAYLSSLHPDKAFGSQVQLLDRADRYRIVVDFAIFQSEGGPVPDGAIIESATLSLYKYSSYDHSYRIYPLLGAWEEASATWNQRLAGVPWAVAGARGGDQDYDTTLASDGLAQWSPGWMTMDVTASVKSMASGAQIHGWVVDPVSGNGNLKRFYSKEYASDGSVRPKLVVRYR